jgi:hypothetical protein
VSEPGVSVMSFRHKLSIKYNSFLDLVSPSHPSLLL